LRGSAGAEEPTLVSVRVVIADDDVLVRAGLRMMIETQSDLEVVGEAGDGAEAVELTRELQPDVVLMDIRMPGMDGLQATREIVDGAALERAEGRDAPRVLVLTTFEIDEYVYEAVRAGASGFLLKRTPPEDLLAGIRVIASGDALLAPSVTRRLMNAFIETSAEPPRPTDVTNRDLKRLTDREREVLVLIAHGLSNGEIAAQLFVAESTVKTHVKRILMKLALRDRVHAVVYAYETGLLRSGHPGCPPTG
jgi:DNA-binding NarL/FixJ family response regulator